MTEPIIFGVLAVPGIVGLVQVARDAGLRGRHAPVLAVLFGIAGGLAQYQAGRLPWPAAAAAGVACGLSACGLYDLGRTIVQRRPA